MLKLLGTILLLVAGLCTTLALSSSYYNNEYFPYITNNEIGKSWGSLVDPQNAIKEPFSCEQLYK